MIKHVLHKTYAGLRDAYRCTGNRAALEMEIKFAQWAEGILSDLTEAQAQRMLNTEFGGMNEVLADLYADTGDKRVANQEVTRSSPARFFDIEYPVAANLVQGREKVTVRFQATEGNVVAAVFGIRMIRADAER